MEASRTELARFVNALFRYANPDTWINLRCFYDDRDLPWRPDLWRSMQATDLGAVVAAAYEIATEAAVATVPVVFCPPVCTFHDGGSCGENNVASGTCFVIDCDREPNIARAKLEFLLGPATLVVASGGIYDGQDKLHLYWRLRTPTITIDERLLLKKARSWGARYAGTDPTSGPVSHPIRWAGSWHRKGTPRLAHIVDESDAEVELHTIFQLLKGVSDAEDGPRSFAATAADPQDLESAMETIPNSNLEWDQWNAIGMALYAATSGSDFGRDLWCSFSSRSPKDDPRRTEERWRHFSSSPPTSTGAGALYARAAKAQPGWRRPGEVAPQFSDEALAIRFADERRNDIRFTAEWSKWHHWTGTYWREDKTLTIFDLTRELCRRVSREANKGAKQIASSRTVGAISNLVRADRRVAGTIDQWNANPWLLGTPEGTVDLKRGIVLANGVGDYITKITSVSPDGDCPLWLSTIDTIFSKDRDLIAYMQRMVGYFLTGSVREEKMFFFHGGGGNGKGTFIETLGYVFGEYATTVAMSTLIINKHAEHPTEIAKLCGVRLAVASETNDAARWNAARIKTLTGGDRVTARFMRTDFFDFMPTHKLAISSNAKPMLGRVDDAIRRRTSMIPFEAKFDVPDTTLKERLRVEAPGILAWAIEGCLLWQRWGLLPPAAVQRATEEYLHDQDDIQIFIDECCELDPASRTPSTHLYVSWQEWCKRAGAYPGSKKDFTQRMVLKFPNPRMVNNLTHFMGVRLTQSAYPSSQDDYRGSHEPPF